MIEFIMSLMLMCDNNPQIICQYSLSPDSTTYTVTMCVKGRSELEDRYAYSGFEEESGKRLLIVQRACREA